MQPGKVKLLRVMRGLNVGGIELRIVNLTRELNHRYGYASEIVTIMEKGNLFEEAREQGIAVHHIPIKHRTNFQGISELRKLIREKEFDIVHTHSFYPNVPGRIAAIVAGAPVIVAHQHSLFSRKCKRGKHKLYEQLLAPFTHKIVAVSQSVKDDYVKYTGISAAKVEVIYNGIDLAPFRRAYEVARLREELGVSGRVVVGSVGRLVPVKGLLTLIDAAPLVSKEIPEVVFMLVGEGSELYKARLLSRIAELNMERHFQLIGYRRDIPALMQMFDIGVLASHFEGFPAVVLEFLASGKPLVATNRGGQSEVLTHDYDALLVPPNSAEALAQSLLAVLRSGQLRERLSGQARATAAKFSLEKMSENFDTFYRSLRAHHKPGYA